MRILLVSTYELGHQPLHVASPAGALARAGHEVRCLDLAVDPFDFDAVGWAEAIACSVPMHTACRLALAACAQVRSLDPSIPICLYGLYARLAHEAATEPVADLAVSGEYEPRLLRWANKMGGQAVDESSPPRSSPPDSTGTGEGAVVELGRGSFGLPARHLLPPLDRYAQLAAYGGMSLAGYVEASHGCSHRCRHCPVPVVYNGRTRLVGVDAVLADIAQLVDMGARHITFGDPDFLNGPHHALRVVSAMHEEFGDLTFDVTAKVEHVLAHRDLWRRFRTAGCVFAVSAFESASETILGHLAKGHHVADEVEAVAVLRSAGIEPRPSLLPFTPWSTAKDVMDLLDLVAHCDLVGNVDPVQYAIRLLVPPGSLLLTSGALEGLLGPYDTEHLGWTWRSGDSRLDSLAVRFARIAEQSGAEGWGAAEAYEAIRGEAFTALGYKGINHIPTSPARFRSAIPPGDRPRLTEDWFCCAEPTEAQLNTAKGHSSTAKGHSSGQSSTASGGAGTPSSGGGRVRSPVRDAEGALTSSGA